MIQEIITYPDERINIASADVRHFDENLLKLIQDLKDTIEAHNAQGISAIQIAVARAVVVVKNEQGEWLELINPRIIKSEGRTTSKETSLYLPEINEEIPRYEKITVVYQDINGEQCSMVAEDEFGFLIQRKIDYIFGGTFANKLDKKSRKQVEQKLSIGGATGEFNATSTMSKREYFKSFIGKLLFFETLFLFSPLFTQNNETLQSFYNYGIFATIGSLILIVAYVAYAKYEASRVISCTGCQVISFTAVAIKYFLMTMVLFTATYFIVKPV